MSKRALDVIVAGLGLILLSPLLVVIAVLVKASDGGRVLFRQQRVGQFGKLFWMWKFRSMRDMADKGHVLITAANDARITPIGAVLRRWKLDELPQLVNVLVGDMTLVGPRPEVPKYVALYTDKQREVLKLRPGITDVATLEFRDEEKLLAGAVDKETFYRQYCLPTKLRLNLEYARGASFWSDVAVIVKTVKTIFHV